MYGWNICIHICILNICVYIEMWVYWRYVVVNFGICVHEFRCVTFSRWYMLHATLIRTSLVEYIRKCVFVCDFVVAWCSCTTCGWTVDGSLVQHVYTVHQPEYYSSCINAWQCLIQSQNLLVLAYQIQAASLFVSFLAMAYVKYIWQVIHFICIIQQFLYVTVFS